MNATEAGMRVAAVVLALGVAGTAGTAGAADVPRAEGFGAYSYARSEDVGLHGWSATLGYNFTRRVEVEAEVSAHYGGAGDGTDVGRQSFLAGPRVNFRAGRVTPFLRALAGAVRTSAGVTVQGVTISARKTSLGSAAGGGVDFALGRSWGLRLQADYVLVRTDGELFGDPRASVGLSYRLSHFSGSR
jgi:opacity protein-like surface antigen